MVTVLQIEVLYLRFDERMAVLNLVGRAVAKSKWLKLRQLCHLSQTVCTMKEWRNVDRPQGSTPPLPCFQL